MLCTKSSINMIRAGKTSGPGDANTSLTRDMLYRRRTKTFRRTIATRRRTTTTIIHRRNNRVLPIKRIISRHPNTISIVTKIARRIRLSNRRNKKLDTLPDRLMRNKRSEHCHRPRLTRLRRGLLRNNSNRHFRQLTRRTVKRVLYRDDHCFEKSIPLAATRTNTRRPVILRRRRHRVTKKRLRRVGTTST